MFTIYKTTDEIKGKVETGCTPYADGQEWKKIKSYETLEEAREALKGFKSSKTHRGGAVPFEQVEEFFISEFDPEDEESTNDIIDFAEWGLDGFHSCGIHRIGDEGGGGRNKE